MDKQAYADARALSFSYRQRPPTSDPFSKQSNGIPRSSNTRHAAIPEQPAPMTAILVLSIVLMFDPSPAALSRVAGVAPDGERDRDEQDGENPGECGEDFVSYGALGVRRENAQRVVNVGDRA